MERIVNTCPPSLIDGYVKVYKESNRQTPLPYYFNPIDVTENNIKYKIAIHGSTEIVSETVSLILKMLNMDNEFHFAIE